MDRVHGCGAVGNELLGSAAEPKGTKHSCNEPEPLGVFVMDLLHCQPCCSCTKAQGGGGWSGSGDEFFT